jgi:uncharacterized protein with GYD domain
VEEKARQRLVASPGFAKPFADPHCLIDNPREEAQQMAKYVTLYSFTDQGIRAVKESPTRLKAAIQAAQGGGMRILGVYYTEGPHDLVVISEAEDERAATAFALTTGAQGNVRSTTMRAWDPDEFEEIVALMP